MTYKEACEQRDRLRADGVHCVVPRSHGPAGYFARIWRTFDGGPLDFTDAAMVDVYLEESAKRRKAAKLAAKPLELSRPRSPLELMIDRACGLA